MRWPSPVPSISTHASCKRRFNPSMRASPRILRASSISIVVLDTLPTTSLRRGRTLAVPGDGDRVVRGVGNPHAIAPLPAGASVVDIGCGAGLDLLLSASHVGPRGRAIGVGMTEAMRDRAPRGA